ncbi:AraC-type DNA-binding protein [Alkalicoccus daliensis]|uniref:AraC-type DNA-binding protein n=2 Tax=Alkalicoccus daliensis TaxID=745820 RepID=A0A1H0CU98_9BACI|nr:AraC-type DNA-binding protein [Alkalicoccus daliensis]
MTYLLTEVPPMPTFIKAGIGKFQPGKQHFYRTFHLFDFIFVKEGTLYIEEKGIQYTLHRGDYLILVPGRLHGGPKPCQVKTEFYWAHFSFPHDFHLSDRQEVDWSTILKKRNTFLTPDVFQLALQQQGSFRRRDQAMALFETLLQPNASNDPAERMRQQLYFFDFLIHVQQESLQVPSSAQQVAHKTMKYVQEHALDEPFLVKNMAAELLYHPDYITRSMKRVTGMTPNQYMTHHRLTLAKEMLQQGEYHLQAVAQECGFTDVSYFSRVFKQREGVTPGEYRRLSGKK